MIKAKEYSSVEEFTDTEFIKINPVRDTYAYAMGEVDTNVDGLFLEFGVHTGGTLRMIAKRFPKKIIYGFDSFEGLPEDWANSKGDIYKGHRKGTFKLNGFPNVPDNARLVVGWFEETLPRFLKWRPEPASFIHVDSDLYSSAKTVLFNLEDRFIEGSVVVFNELKNYPYFREHEAKALYEFLCKTDKNFSWCGGHGGHVGIICNG
jgi:hypothetical protein